VIVIVSISSKLLRTVGLLAVRLDLAKLNHVSAINAANATILKCCQRRLEFGVMNWSRIEDGGWRMEDRCNISSLYWLSVVMLQI